MRIFGEWYECDDGIVRPTMVANLLTRNVALRGLRFLVDTAADRTVLTAELVPALPPLQPPPEGIGLAGVGGRATFGVLQGALQFPRQGLEPIIIRGDFAVLTNLAAADMPVIGISRRHDTVVLLAGNHRYRIEGP